MTRVSQLDQPQLDQQSIEISSDNPLATQVAPKVAPKKVSFKERLKDPKIKLLTILSSVLIILLLLTIVAAIFKKKPTQVVYQPAALPTLLPTPTISQSGIPQAWAQKLNDRENEVKNTEDFTPPQIDTSIGL